MDIYTKFEKINNLPIKDKINGYYESALVLLQQGCSVEKIKILAKDCLEFELYEVSQGILNAIKNFQKTKKNHDTLKKRLPRKNN